MLTPVDVQNKVFKGGIGYDKRDVEMFIREIAADYEQLYRSNVELKDKVTTLNESLQHYRATEDSMQKALTLSEKTAEETINAANDKARQTISVAEKQAEDILASSKEELAETKDEIFRLQRLHARFKSQYTKILEGQLKLIEGEVEDIDLGEGYDIGGFENSSSISREGGLGGLGDGGGYTGASSFDARFERTAQEPTINRTSLNMDPFTDAANGGGRFSRQTGKGFVNADDKKKNTKTDSKGGLNVKNAKGSGKKNSRVKKDFTSPDSVAANKAAAEAAYAKKIDEEKEKKAAKINRATKTTEESKTDAVKETPITSTETNSSYDSSSSFSASTSTTEFSSSATETTNTDFSSIEENTTSTTETTTSTAEYASTTSNYSSSEFDTSSSVENSSEDSSYYSTQESSGTFASDDVASGEVESKFDEGSLLGNDDDDDEGFSFMNDDVWASESTKDETNSYSTSDFSDDTVSGEVEDKISESTLLGNDDDNDEGLDFVEEATEEEMSAYLQEKTIVSGEVEDRNAEASMLDSEDNYGEDFDFVVNEEESALDDIPTISSILNTGASGDSSSFDTSNDVLEGAVESAVNRTSMIGNDDNQDDGFSFL